MGYIDQTTSQITGIGSLHGGISQTLTGTVGRDEVLQHGHTLLEVRQNRVLNRTTTLGTGLLRLGHQTTDTGQLLNLVLRTTGTGVEHHEHGIEALVGLGHLIEQDGTDIIVHMRPGIDDLIVTLIVGDEAHVIVVGDLLDLCITLRNQLCLLLRDDDIVEVERQTCEICHTVTEVLDTIEELAGFGETDILDDISDDITQTLLGNDGIDITNLLRDDTIDDDTADRGLYHVALRLAVDDIVDNHLHLGMEVALTLVVGDDSLFGSVEGQTFTLGTRADLRDIIETQHHIL